jgi:hypothetical protein
VVALVNKPLEIQDGVFSTPKNLGLGVGVVVADLAMAGM